jgi:hypothetical protein
MKNKEWVVKSLCFGGSVIKRLRDFQASISQSLNLSLTSHRAHSFFILFFIHRIFFTYLPGFAGGKEIGAFVEFCAGVTFCPMPVDAARRLVTFNSGDQRYP